MAIKFVTVDPGAARKAPEPAPPTERAAAKAVPTSPSSEAPAGPEGELPLGQGGKAAKAKRRPK